MCMHETPSAVRAFSLMAELSGYSMKHVEGPLCDSTANKYNRFLKPKQREADIATQAHRKYSSLPVYQKM